jgi:hypothetical protein
LCWRWYGHGSVILDSVKAHAPLPERAHVDHGVGFVVTENHLNRAAGRGCHVASCYASLIVSLAYRYVLIRRVNYHSLGSNAPKIGLHHRAKMQTLRRDEP